MAGADGGQAERPSAMPPAQYALLSGGMKVPILMPAHELAPTGADADAAEGDGLLVGKGPKKSTNETMHIVVCVLTHVRDAAMLVLGGSLLHVGANVLGTENVERVEKCVFMEPFFVVLVGVLWAITLVCAVTRYRGYLGLVPDTLLDLSLVFLGAALQISVKPTDWISSVEDRWCSISAADIGPLPLLAWLLGEALSFVSSAKTVVDWATRPPCGTPGVLWVIVYGIAGAASFPLIDGVLSPALRELVDNSLNGTLVES